MDVKLSPEVVLSTEMKPSTSDILPIENPSKLQKSNAPKKRRKPVDAVIDGNNTKKFKLKRRKIKVEGAPKMPLTGYVRYMNARREQLRIEQPTKTAIEHTKIIGEEWNQLSDQVKAPYMADAEVDRQRYLRELNIFLKDHPDVLASELAKNKAPRKSQNGNQKSVLTDKIQQNGINANVNSNTNSNEKSNTNTEKGYTIIKVPTNIAPIGNKPEQNQNSLPTNNNNKIASSIGSTTTSINGRDSIKTNNTSTDPSVIQIFTDDFLDHNKTVDLELRTLRKSNTDLEVQNSVLEKYIDQMRFGVEKMENENNELEEKNRLLEAYLDKLKIKLAAAFSGLAIPSEPMGATLDNIEKYMFHLYNMSTSNTHGPASLNKAKDIIRKLDLHIQL